MPEVDTSEGTTASKEDSPTSRGMSLSLSPDNTAEEQRMQNSDLTAISKEDLTREEGHLYRRKFRSKIIKTKYVNVLAFKYYAKHHLFFIFLPIQLLSVWTAISGAVFAYHISRNTYLLCKSYRY